MRKLLVVLVLLCVAPAGASPLRLAPEAQRILGAATGAGGFRVDCSYAFRNGDGYAQPAYRRQPAIVWVKPYVCRQVNGLWQRRPVSDLTARALLVLTHETLHVSSFSGARDEALTECRALQMVSSVAVKLGARADVAAALGRRAVSHHLELIARQPRYEHPECRAGGDLDTGSGLDWPNPLASPNVRALR